MGHLSEKELLGRLNVSWVRAGERYVHHRMPDQPYEVVAVGFLEENEEPAVVYKALYGEGLTWVRKLSNFVEEVEHEGKKVSRFRKIS